MKSLNRILSASPCRPQRAGKEDRAVPDGGHQSGLSGVRDFIMPCFLQTGRVFGDLLFGNLYDYSDFGYVKRAVKWEVNVCLQLVTVAREVP